jgi:hypothetical protein
MNLKLFTFLWIHLLLPVLGKYHNFMLAARFGFHKVWYPLDIVFPRKNFKIYTPNKGINFFFN